MDYPEDAEDAVNAVNAAVVQGSVEKLKKLIQSGYPVDRQDGFGETPLMESIMHGYRHIAEYLIDKVSRYSLELRNRQDRWNVLHLMARYGRPWIGIWHKIVKIAPNCLQHQDKEGLTPLQLLGRLRRQSKGHETLHKEVVGFDVSELIKMGNIKQLQTLYRVRWRFKTESARGQDCLMLAITLEKEDIALFFAKKSSRNELMVEDMNKNNALHYMAMYGRPWYEVWLILTQKCPKFLFDENDDKMTPMAMVIKNRDKSIGHKQLFEYAKDAVNAAVVKGDLEKLKELIQSGYPVDKQDSFGETPLMESIMHGHRFIAKYLIGRVSHYSLELNNHKNGWNVLHLMARYGRPWMDIWNTIAQIAPNCLQHQDKEGLTPIQLLDQSNGHKTLYKENGGVDVSDFIKMGDIKQLETLYSGGWRFKRKNDSGKDCLMLAITYEKEDIALFLAKKSSRNELMVEDMNKNNALHYMAMYGRPWYEVWHILTQKCPKRLFDENDDKMTPIAMLIKHRDKSIGHKKLFEYATEKDDVNDRVNDLVKIGDLEELRNLHYNGISLETQNKIRQTSLMLAIAHDREDIAMFLESIVPADFTLLQDKFGCNALHYIAVFGRPWNELWQLLSQNSPVLLCQQDIENTTPVDLVIKNREKSEGHRNLYGFIIEKGMPSFVKTLAREDVTKFVSGLEEHAEETRNIKVMVIGHEMVGKTCLVKQLLREHINLENLFSTNVAELHLRRLLLDMLTLERISGASAKDIILERLRMVSNKIRENERKVKIDSETTKESKSSTDVSTQKVHDKGDTVMVPLMPEHDLNEEIKDSRETDKDTLTSLSFRDDTDRQTTESESDTDRQTTESELSIDNVTEQQTELFELVLHEEADSRYKTKAFVTIYDFGGEEVFHNIQHSLMTSDSIFLLVFDVAMCLNTKHEQEGLESIVKWLYSIATHAVEDDEVRKGTPPVLLIASHMDLLTETEELKREKLDLFLDKLRSVPGIKEIMKAHIKGIFPVANLNDSSKNADIFQQIWETIKDVAPLQSQWKKHIPGKWIALEFELLQKKESGVKVMTIEELMEMNKNLAIPLEDIESVMVFLRYLHMTGFMLCFDLKSENPIIVLNAQWVIDAFKCLITANKFVTGLSISEKTLWEELEKTGRLPFDVLKMIWLKHPKDQFLDHIHVLVAAMERLGLLVKPLPKEKNEEINFYVVPSMLKMAEKPEVDAIRHILHETATAKSGTLCIQFQKRFIPQAIWDKLIAACIHRFQLFTVPDRNFLGHCYRGSVALAIDHIWNLLIHCRENVMKATLFTTQNETQVPPGTGYNIRLVLEDVLKQILTMNHEGHMTFDYFLHFDPIVSHGDVSVEARRLLLDSPLESIQTTRDGQIRVDIERTQYDVWFQKPSEKAEQLCDVDLQRRPTVKELGRIAKLIYGSYHMFFIELGMKDAEICQIRHTCGHLSFRSQVTKIFLSWCSCRRNVDLHQIGRAMDTLGLGSHTMMEEIAHIKDEIILKDSGIPEEQLKRPPEEELVKIIAGYIDASYFNLYLELGLEPRIIVQHELDYKDSGVKTMFTELLNAWIQHAGEEATLNRILVAMQECNMPVYDLTNDLMLNIGNSEC